MSHFVFCLICDLLKGILFLNDLQGLYDIQIDEDCGLIIVEVNLLLAPPYPNKPIYLYPLPHQEALQNNELPCNTVGFTQKYSVQNNKTYHPVHHSQSSNQMA